MGGMGDSQMSGNRRDQGHPVLVEDGITTVMDREKAEIMAKTCIVPIIYQRRERLAAMYRWVKVGKQVQGDEDAPFTIGELRMALVKTGKAAPGKSCYD